MASAPRSEGRANGRQSESPVAINQLSGASAARRRWQSMDKEADSASMLLRSELAGRRRSSGTESTPTDKARRISQLFQKNSLREQLTRVAASDPSLKVLDLSGSTRFMSLTVKQKGQAIGLLAQGQALETLVLNSLRLDNTSAAALAGLLRSNNSLLSVSLEGNSLTEEGLVAIAAGLEGHPALCELTVANQRAPLSNAAVSALLQATIPAPIPIPTPIAIPIPIAIPNPNPPPGHGGDALSAQARSRCAARQRRALAAAGGDHAQPSPSPSP